MPGTTTSIIPTTGTEMSVTTLALALGLPMAAVAAVRATWSP